ncbi:MAG TPA: phage baseplate assembly protein V, partial [Kofleriaceae bacterium]|nr:phage baseplate assembly protein V [Kofleriaceae bacterium]
MTLFPIDRPMETALRAAKMRGVHLAIVVENKDGGDNPGYRVCVKYPWMNEQEKSFWARIAIPMAGKERGTYFLPEVDDQLLVVFEHGDINKPIVIGALWSKKQEPVEINESGKNNTKLIKSRAGHRIIFDDKDGAEKITIVDKTKKNKIVLDSANKVVKIESAGDIEVKAAANVIMHSNALKVGTSDTFTAKGQQVLTHSGAAFGVKASSNITVNGAQVQINVVNSPAARVSGSGAGELGGAAAETPKDQVQEQTRGGGGGGGGGGAGGGGGGGPAPAAPEPAPSSSSSGGGSSSGGSGSSSAGTAGSPGGASGQPGGGQGGASGSASASATASGGASGSAQGGAAGGAQGGASGSASAGATASGGASGSAQGGAGGGAQGGASGSASAGATASGGASGSAQGGAGGGAQAGASGSAGAGATASGGASGSAQGGAGAQGGAQA